MATKPSTSKQGADDGPISIHPSSFVATGLPNNFTAVVKKARFIPWHYPNRPDLDPQCSLNLTLETDEANGAPPVVEQTYSAGKLKFFVPSKTANGAGRVNLNSENKEDWEGPFLVKAPDSTVTAIARQSNYSVFINAAIEAGLNPDDIPADGDARFLEGYKIRFARVEVEGRSGAAQGEQKASSKSDGKVLLPVEVLGKEAAGKKSKAAVAEAPAKATKTSKKAVVEEDDDEGETLEVVLEKAIAEALEEKSPISQKGLAKVIFKTGASAADQKTMSALIGNDEWMNADERPWMYDEDSGSVTAVGGGEEDDD